MRDFQDDGLVTDLNALTAVTQLHSLDGRRPRHTRLATPCVRRKLKN